LARQFVQPSRFNIEAIVRAVDVMFLLILRQTRLRLFVLIAQPFDLGSDVAAGLLSRINLELDAYIEVGSGEGICDGRYELGIVAPKINVQNAAFASRDDIHFLEQQFSQPVAQRAAATGGFLELGLYSRVISEFQVVDNFQGDAFALDDIDLGGDITWHQLCRRTQTGNGIDSLVIDDHRDASHIVLGQDQADCYCGENGHTQCEEDDLVTSAQRE